MDHRLNRRQRNGIRVTLKAIAPAQGGDTGALVPDGSGDAPDYGHGFILGAATENVTGYVAVFGPGMN